MNAFQRDFRPALPDALEVEQSMLGALLLKNEVFHSIAGIIDASAFHEPLHQRMFDVIAEMIRSGKRATPVSIKEFFRDDAMKGEMSVSQYLAKLMMDGTGMSSPASDAALLRDLATRRSIISAGEDIARMAYEAAPDDTGASILGRAQERLFDVDAGADDGAMLTAASEVDRMMSNQGTVARPTVPLPLPQLEEVMRGLLEAGNLYGMLSGSGEGKTSMVMQIIRHAAELGHPVLFLSYDQLWDQCLIQMASQRLGIEAARLKDETRLQTKEREKKWEAISDLRRLPLAYKKCSGRRDGSAQLAAYAKRFLTTFAPRFEKVPLIVLDHVRKVKPKSDRDHEGRISAEVNGVCKDIAAEHDAVWLSLNQRSSTGAKRKNPRPIDADIYGGEMAREDYDGIFYLYRAWKYRKTQLATAADEREEREVEARFAREKWEEDHAELGALKVRWGDPSIRRRIRFEGEFTRYVSMREQSDPALFEEGF
jgi:replicative DNA helicase